MWNRLPRCGSVVDSDVVSIRMKFTGQDLFGTVEQAEQIGQFVRRRIEQRKYVAPGDDK
jgi:hypothetical protein